jgi:hypothetical protein
MKKNIVRFTLPDLLILFSLLIFLFLINAFSLYFNNAFVTSFVVVISFIIESTITLAVSDLQKQLKNNRKEKESNFIHYYDVHENYLLNSVFNNEDIFPGNYSIYSNIEILLMLNRIVKGNIKSNDESFIFFTNKYGNIIPYTISNIEYYLFLKEVNIELLRDACSRLIPLENVYQRIFEYSDTIERKIHIKRLQLGGIKILKDVNLAEVYLGDLKIKNMQVFSLDKTNGIMYSNLNNSNYEDLLKELIGNIKYFSSIKKPKSYAIFDLTSFRYKNYSDLLGFALDVKCLLTIPDINNIFILCEEIYNLLVKINNLNNAESQYIESKPLCEYKSLNDPGIAEILVEETKRKKYIENKKIL